MRMCAIFYFLLIHTIQLIASEEDCDITQFYNKLLVVSNQPEVAEDAGNICSSSGGSFAQISSPAERKELSDFLKKNLVPSGLELVKIYQDPDEVNNRKYRPSFPVNDFVDIEDWPRPDKGELRSFFLYKNQTIPFTTGVQFCYVTKKDMLRYDCHGGSDGWNSNFNLYGWNNTTPNTIILYAYYHKTHHSTVLFLNDSVSNPDLIKQSSSNLVSEIFIPDISVFIGARSDVNQTKWYWNNNTEVNNTMFPESNSSLCQQMTWPLTYDDGINLRPKQCNKKAYFACQFTLNIQASAVPCDGSMLRISWNRFNFNLITGKTSDYQAIIKVINQNKSNQNEEEKQFKVDLKQNQQTIMGLKKQTTYKIEVQARSDSCDDSLSFSTSATTSFGVPDPAENPRIMNQSVDDCMIDWQYPDKQHRDNIQYYMVYYYFPTSKSYKVLKEELKVINGFYIYEPQFFEIPSNSTVVFKIQVFSCEGGSEIRNVSGSCIAPHRGSSTIIIIVVTVVFGCIGILLLILLLKRKQAKSRKVSSNSNTEDLNQKGSYLQDEEVNTSNGGYLQVDEFNTNRPTNCATNQVCSNTLHQQPSDGGDIYEVMTSDQTSPEESKYEAPIDFRRQPISQTTHFQGFIPSSVRTCDPGTDNIYKNESVIRDEIDSGEATYENY